MEYDFMSYNVNLIVAGATLCLALVTLRMALATEKTIQELAKPNVIVYPKLGNSGAFDVDFEIPAYFPHKAHGVAEPFPEPENMPANYVLRHGIKYLAPHEKRLLDWGTYSHLESIFKKNSIDCIKVPAS